MSVLSIRTLVLHHSGSHINPLPCYLEGTGPSIFTILRRLDYRSPQLLPNLEAIWPFEFLHEDRMGLIKGLGPYMSLQ